ncbi:hypothetical protein EVAR_52630_1 [Eumeta japonica]|uniref:Uncharacterized protein n=1 Tax=Eumeta variegata TaxID=151549 RepID=A0A4C1Y1P7_EUMVA|nr:hypothetical protein EVAR_52630_1 [Eumeta japonica]
MVRDTTAKECTTVGSISFGLADEPPCRGCLRGLETSVCATVKLLGSRASSAACSASAFTTDGRPERDLFPKLILFGKIASTGQFWTVTFEEQTRMRATENTCSPPLMVTRNPKGVTSAFSAFIVGIGHLIDWKLG